MRGISEWANERMSESASGRISGVLRGLGVLLLVGALLLAASALAQSPQQTYDLSWHTVDGGGHTRSSGGSYTLGGTIGQPDAGGLAGGAYTLGGGFWHGGALAEVLYEIYLPLVLRNH